MPSEEGPDAIILGAAKTGTTSVHKYLGQHPDIFVTFPKELRIPGNSGWSYPIIPIT